MRIDIKKFLKDTGLEERFYPGKRLIKKCIAGGEYKSHAIVYDWRSPDLIHVEVKPGLSGQDLPKKELAKYPASLQTRTFFEIDVKSGEVTKYSDDEEESEGKGKSGGGKSPAKTKLEDKGASLSSFMKAVEGAVPEAGELKRAVVMGMEIAKEAFAPVLDAFIAQADKAKIVSSDILSKAGKYITKCTPPAFLEAKGNEDIAYSYNRERNESMFGMNLN